MVELRLIMNRSLFLCGGKSGTTWIPQCTRSFWLVMKNSLLHCGGNSGPIRVPQGYQFFEADYEELFPLLCQKQWCQFCTTVLLNLWGLSWKAPSSFVVATVVLMGYRSITKSLRLIMKSSFLLCGWNSGANWVPQYYQIFEADHE